MPNRDKSIDLINTPMDRAFKRFQEETAEAIEALVPNRRDPITQQVHSMGLTLKGLRDGTATKTNTRPD
jgi:hypothetical protein